MIVQGLEVMEEEHPMDDAKDMRGDGYISYYLDSDDLPSGVHITTKLQFTDIEGNFGRQQFTWIHKDVIPDLIATLTRFMETGEIESKNT